MPAFEVDSSNMVEDCSKALTVNKSSFIRFDELAPFAVFFVFVDRLWGLCRRWHAMKPLPQAPA